MTTVGADIVVTSPLIVIVCGGGVGPCSVDRTVVVVGACSVDRTVVVVGACSVDSTVVMDGACVSCTVTDTVVWELSESVTV